MATASPLHVPSRHGLHTSYPDCVVPIGRNHVLDHPLSTTEHDRNVSLQLARARVLLERPASDWVASGITAALIWGFPVLTPGIDIHVMRATHSAGRRCTIGEEAASHPSSTVYRHRLTYPPEALTEHNGLRVLRPDYVIIELLSLRDPLAAIIAAEAAVQFIMRPLPWQREATEDSWLDLREHLLEISEARPSKRYKRRVRDRLNIIGPHSQSPAESLAVCRLWEAGITKLIQQLPWSVEGRDYYLDFGSPTCGVALEIDGKTKYTGDSSSDVVYREKLREDALRQDFPTFVRLRWADLWRADASLALRDRLPAELRGHPHRRLA